MAILFENVKVSVAKQNVVAMVIFLQFYVSGNAISIAATHMSLFTDLFAFISFKSKKTRMARKFVIFQNFEKLSIFKFAYFLQFIKC